MGSTLVDQQCSVLGSQFQRVVLLKSLRCAVNAVLALDVCDGLDIVDHESAAGQSNAEGLGDVVFGHVGEPRRSSKPTCKMSVHEQTKEHVVGTESCLGDKSMASVFVIGPQGPLMIARTCRIMF